MFNCANPLLRLALSILLVLAAALVCPKRATAVDPHVVTVRSHNLYPDSVVWDPHSQHFVVGSFHGPSLHAVSDAGVAHSLVPPDPFLPAAASVLGVALDPPRRLLLAVLRLSPTSSALASFDLHLPPPLPRRSLTPLPSPSSANDLALDPLGNAFVSDSSSNLLWLVPASSPLLPTLFSNSSAFHSHPIYADHVAAPCGLSGVAYHSNGYLLVAQSNTGKLFKVDAVDGHARRVLLSKDLPGADAIALRRDGTLVVVAHDRAWFVRSNDGWAEAAVFDEVPLDAARFASGVAVREGRRAYVLYGHINEVMAGNVDRDVFGIEEIESERERQGDNVWMFVLIGFGLAYFCFWRFQMRRLVTEVNKKRS